MTTITYAHREWSPIGAIELKSSYRGNMAKAVLVVVLLFAAVLAGIALTKMLASKDEIIVVQRPGPTIDIARLGLPPSVAEKSKQIAVSLETKVPKFQLPEVAPDEQVTEEYVVMAPGDYVNLSPGPVADDGAFGSFRNVAVPPDSEIFPEQEEFVSYDEAPVVISLPTPKYPEMARKAGIEGKVQVEALIDTRGKVRDARIVISSGTNAGFEEAALEAALKGVWRPAMQNKQPVVVSVSYPVVFRLR